MCNPAPSPRFPSCAQVDFDVELVWREKGYDGVRMLQARAPVQPPVVEHPVSGEPTWFCNVHSHSSVLRKQREQLYGAERFESGASQINKSDMYYGTLEARRTTPRFAVLSVLALRA